jgi:hypothetical protein
LERIDYPFSLIINFIDGQLHYRTALVEPWVVDMLDYSILGSIWYFGLGWIFRFAILQLRKTAAHTS